MATRKTKKKAVKRMAKTEDHDVVERYYLTCKNTATNTNKFYDIIIVKTRTTYRVLSFHGRIGKTRNANKPVDYNSLSAAKLAAGKLKAAKMKKKPAYNIDTPPKDEYSAKKAKKRKETRPLYLELEEEGLERFSNMVFD